jgi:hypothetical protein
LDFSLNIEFNTCDLSIIFLDVCEWNNLLEWRIGIILEYKFNICCQCLIPPKVKVIYKTSIKLLFHYTTWNHSCEWHPLTLKWIIRILYNYPNSLGYIWKFMYSSIQLIFKICLNDLLGWWDL